MTCTLTADASPFLGWAAVAVFMMPPPNVCCPPKEPRTAFRFLLLGQLVFSPAKLTVLGLGLRQPGPLKDRSCLAPSGPEVYVDTSLNSWPSICLLPSLGSSLFPKGGCSPADSSHRGGPQGQSDTPSQTCTMRMRGCNGCLGCCGRHGAGNHCHERFVHQEMAGLTPLITGACI